jgi:membrane-bound lytic murein transglycosylase MltF
VTLTCKAATLLLLLSALAALGCGKPAPKAAAPAPAAPSPAPATPLYESAIPSELRPLVDKAYTGDLDGMVHHRMIRIGAPYSRTFYFIDKGVQRGLAYEYANLFEDWINKQLGAEKLKVQVVLIPMPRDMMLRQLRAGKVDLVVAQLTVTPERLRLVDFTNPTRTNINEVLVTGPGAPSVRSLDDLGDAKVYVRRSSSYFASLQALNAQRKARGQRPIGVDTAPESLEDDDLLEMVNAGLAPATVVDDYMAELWKKVFPNIVVHNDLPLRAGGNLAVAIRKNSPELAARLNQFIAQYGLNTAIGATINKRYLVSTDFVKDAASTADRQKFLTMVSLFRKYGGEYSFDYLLMAAQAYQESRLDQEAKSHVGAIGIMQLMPKTGAEQDVGDIHQLEPNIHAGVKYMRFMRNQYFEKEPMDDLDKGLFTFAAYNAGAGRIRQLRQEAAQRGLNPNVWFGNVERVASERIGRETVTYVSNIYKYYLAYTLVVEQARLRTAAKSELAKQAAPKPAAAVG